MLFAPVRRQQLGDPLADGAVDLGAAEPIDEYFVGEGGVDVFGNLHVVADIAAVVQAPRQVSGKTGAHCEKSGIFVEELVLGVQINGDMVAYQLLKIAQEILGQRVASDLLLVVCLVEFLPDV